MNAYDKLREELYTDSFDLQVRPRTRGFATAFITTVLSGTTDANQTVPGPLLLPGDGILFDHVSLSLQPAATDTVILASASFGFLNVAAQIASAQFSTQPNSGIAGIGGLNLFFRFDVNPRLWTAFDINGLIPKAGPAAGATFKFFFTVTDSGGPQTVTFETVVYWRLVRGLQEN